MWFWRLASPKSVGWARKQECHGRADAVDQVWRPSVGWSVLAWGRSVISLVRSSTDWMRPTHIMEGNLIYVLVAFKKHSHRNIQTNGWPNTRALWPNLCKHWAGYSGHSKWYFTSLIYLLTVFLLRYFTSFKSSLYSLPRISYHLGTPQPISTDLLSSTVALLHLVLRLPSLPSRN